MSSALLRGALGAAACLSFAYPTTAPLAQTALPPVDINAPQQQVQPGASEQGTPVAGGDASPNARQQTTAGPVRGYQAETVRSATRTDTPIENIPASIEVIPRKVIEDQGAVTQSEVLRNVSGVQPLNPITFGQLNPKVRGFPAERVTDGLPNYYDAGARDLTVNIERIEVLKGPQGVLFQGGTNATGGIINVVSKLPTMTRFAEFGLRFGSYGMLSPWVDFNTPLNASGTVLFRVTGQT